MSLFNQRGQKAFEAGPIKVTQVASTRPNAVPVQMQVPLKDPRRDATAARSM